MINGYEENYLSLIYKLKECDFKDAARNLSLKLLDDDSLGVSFLLRDYIITKDGVIPADGKPSKATIRSILLFYAASGGRGEPSYTYGHLHSFSNGLIPSTSNSKMTTPLTRYFAGKYEKFREALEVLGAVYTGCNGSGEHVWTYGLLPKIPCQIKYIEEDEDFPAETRVLLDNNAGLFLEFEQMAFLIGSLADAVTSIGETGWVQF